MTNNKIINDYINFSIEEIVKINKLCIDNMKNYINEYIDDKIEYIDKLLIDCISTSQKEILRNFNINYYKDIKSVSVASIYNGSYNISYNELEELIQQVNKNYNTKLEEIKNKSIVINYSEVNQKDIFLFYSTISHHICILLETYLKVIKESVVVKLNELKLEYDNEMIKLNRFGKIFKSLETKIVVNRFDSFIKKNKAKYSNIKSVIIKASCLFKKSEKILYDSKCFYELVNNILSIINIENSVSEEIKNFLILTIEHSSTINTNIINKINITIEQHLSLETKINVNNIEKNVFDEILSINLLNDNFNCTLRKYQEFAVKFCLHNKRILLGDEMGLGKTIQALSVISHLHNLNQKKAIVVVPLSISYLWMDEVKKHTNIQCFNLRDEGMKSKWFTNGGILVASYETITKTIGAFELLNMKIDIVVADECHYIKSYRAKRTVACIKLFNFSEYTLLMSGTPLENNALEMIQMFYMLHCDTSPLHRAYNNPKLFKEVISSRYIRRKREDVLNELPTKEEFDIPIEISSEEYEIYTNDLLSDNYQRARQISFTSNKKSSKVGYIKDLCDEAVASNKKVLIFSNFLNTLNLLNTTIKNSIGIISGSVSPKERNELVKRFTDYDGGSVLCAQIVSGGVGLNIQCASVVIICEPQEKPSTEDQAISRAYRMGQVNNVLVYRIYVPNTIEDVIREKLSYKRKIFNDYADESYMGDASKLLEKNVELKDIMKNSLALLNNKIISTHQLNNVKNIKIIENKNSSVTQFCDSHIQPSKGYLPVNSMRIIKNEDSIELYTSANAGIIGLVVDYLSRYEIVKERKEDVFYISRRGASLVNQLEKIDIMLKLIEPGLSSMTIQLVAKIVTFDAVYRAGKTDAYNLEFSLSDDDITNIRKMVLRVKQFHFKYNILETGMTFDGSYTSIISKGDADILTTNGLWDLKVISNNITSKHTFQLLLYYVLSLKKYKNIKFIGIFNPKKNIEYVIDVNEISSGIIEAIKTEINYK
ncbi:MAG: DEAD/DEAH box helicase [Peptostreptococcaceae bacterium]